MKNNNEKIINYGIGVGYRCLAYGIEQAYERRITFALAIDVKGSNLMTKPSWVPSMFIQSPLAKTSNLMERIISICWPLSVKYPPYAPA